MKVLSGDEEGLERPGHLGGVERGVARPLEQVLVHVPVIAAQDRIQLPVVEIEGIHQRHGVGPEPGQELLDVSGDLQGLGNTQQPGLRGTRGPEPSEPAGPNCPTRWTFLLPTTVRARVRF